MTCGEIIKEWKISESFQAKCFQNIPENVPGKKKKICVENVQVFASKPCNISKQYYWHFKIFIQNKKTILLHILAQTHFDNNKTDHIQNWCICLQQTECKIAPNECEFLPFMPLCSTYPHSLCGPINSFIRKSSEIRLLKDCGFCLRCSLLLSFLLSLNESSCQVVSTLWKTTVRSSGQQMQKNTFQSTKP